jgi:hypothetical protein
MTKTKMSNQKKQDMQDFQSLQQTQSAQRVICILRHLWHWLMT